MLTEYMLSMGIVAGRVPRKSHGKLQRCLHRDNTWFDNKSTGYQAACAGVSQLRVMNGVMIKQCFELQFLLLDPACEFKIESASNRVLSTNSNPLAFIS